MGGGIGQNRRALSNINRNLIGALPYPCAINKRALVEKQVPLEKKQAPIPVHRPVTRKFAAQLASKHQTPDGRNNQHALFTAALRHEPVPIDSEDCIIIDSEEYKRKIEEPVPMYVQQTEEMMEEIDRMEKEKETEIEMEDIDEDPVVDIDLADENNPLAVVEYIDSIYAFYKKVEGTSCVSPNYMVQQCDINERMRGILIDWLIEVHYKFELMEETLYLTVNLIDRFLAAQPVVRKKLQLVGVTAMLLACKYEEVSVPVVDDLILISDKAYTRQEVLNMEKLMVNALQFNLSAPTPYVFMRRFLKAAQSDKKLELLAFFMVELCLVEYEMLKFPPSFLAAAAIYTAQSTLVGSKQWTKTSEFHTCYPLEQLQDCARQMVTFHQNAATGKLTGVHRKYSTSKYGYAARTAPALFLLEDDHRL